MMISRKSYASDTEKSSRCLFRLLVGANDFEKELLFTKYDTMFDAVYMVDASTAFVASPESIPWTVALTLSTLNRKHILRGGQVPDINTVAIHANNFIQKLKWAHFHRNSSDSVRLLKLKGTTPHCRHGGPLELQALCNGLRKRLMSACNVGISRCGGDAKAYSNIRPFHRAAFDWLRASPYKVVLTEKDGIFALVPRVHFRSLVAMKLKPSTYSPVYDSAIKPSELMSELHKHTLACALHCGSDSLVREAMSWAADHVGGWVSPLHYNVKTHKDPGEVGVRILHNGGQSPLTAIMRFLRIGFADSLKQCSHLCFSTSDFISKLRSVKVGPDDKLVRLDLEDFFMAVSHNTLCDFAYPLGPQCYKDALRFILSSQFVKSSDPDGLFQVVKGSGMGTEISGDLCDLVLFNLAEAELLKPESLNHFHITTWLRYRDDIFFIARDRPLMHAFVQKFRTLLRGVWRFKCEDVSTSAVNMLDLTVFKIAHGGGVSIGWKPFIKDSKRFVPLSCSSAHAPGVFNWPVAQIDRLYANSCAVSFFLPPVVDFILGLTLARYDGEVVAKCVHKAFLLASDAPHQPLRIHKVASRRFVFVLGYHPCFRFVVPNVLYLVAKLYSLELAFLFGDASLQCAWSNPRAPVHTLLRKL